MEVEAPTTSDHALRERQLGHESPLRGFAAHLASPSANRAEEEVRGPLLQFDHLARISPTRTLHTTRQHSPYCNQDELVGLRGSYLSQTA